MMGGVGRDRPMRSLLVSTILVVGVLVVAGIQDATADGGSRSGLPTHQRSMVTKHSGSRSVVRRTEETH